MDDLYSQRPDEATAAANPPNAAEEGQEPANPAASAAANSEAAAEAAAALPTPPDGTPSGAAAGDPSPSGKPYKVGYRQPPLEHRFQKGGKGNPKGRKKGSKNHKTEWLEVASEKVQIIVGGRPRLVSRSKGTALVLQTAALKGSVPAARTCLEHNIKFDPPEQADREEVPLTPTEQTVIDELYGRQAARRGAKRKGEDR